MLNFINIKNPDYCWFPSLAVLRQNEGASPILGTNRHIQAFVKLVNEHFLDSHDVQFFTDKLFIMPNYLNRLTKEYLEYASKSFILHRVILEAKNLLHYTTLSVVMAFDRRIFISRII